MEQLIFRRPVPGDERQLKEYVAEHHAYGEQSISASFGLSKLDYAQWLRMLHDNEEKGNDFGKSLLLVCCAEETIVGLLSIRYDMPRLLAEKYGHIGYGVRPTMRGRGCATQMLRYALQICREYGRHEVILGCFADNKASAAVIEKNGGVFLTENENYRPGCRSRYYTITIKE